jgi:hypothetical protein
MLGQLLRKPQNMARKKTSNKKLIETTRVKIRTVYKKLQKIKSKN